LCACLTSAAPVSTCPPYLGSDRIPISASCGLDAPIATPGALYGFGWNDNERYLPFWDWDFEDLLGTIQFSPDAQSATLTYLGHGSGFWNTMSYNGVRLFDTWHSTPGATVTISTAPGTAPVFSLDTIVLVWHETYSSLDSDHFRSWCFSGCNPLPPNDPVSTPEPASLAYGAIGVAAIALGSIRHGKGTLRATAPVTAPVDTLTVSQLRALWALEEKS